MPTQIENYKIMERKFSNVKTPRINDSLNETSAPVVQKLSIKNNPFNLTQLDIGRLINFFLVLKDYCCRPFKKLNDPKKID